MERCSLAIPFNFQQKQINLFFKFHALIFEAVNQIHLALEHCQGRWGVPGSAGGRG